jgi:hypothetical protein
MGKKNQDTDPRSGMNNQDHICEFRNNFMVTVRKAGHMIKLEELFARWIIRLSVKLVRKNNKKKTT